MFRWLSNTINLDNFMEKIYWPICPLWSIDWLLMETLFELDIVAYREKKTSVEKRNVSLFCLWTFFYWNPYANICHSYQCDRSNNHLIQIVGRKKKERRIQITITQSIMCIPFKNFHFHFDIAFCMCVCAYLMTV